MRRTTLQFITLLAALGPLGLLAPTPSSAQQNAPPPENPTLAMALRPDEVLHGPVLDDGNIVASILNGDPVSFRNSRLAFFSGTTVDRVIDMPGYAVNFVQVISRDLSADESVLALRGGTRTGYISRIVRISGRNIKTLWDSSSVKQETTRETVFITSPKGGYWTYNWPENDILLHVRIGTVPEREAMATFDVSLGPAGSRQPGRQDDEPSSLFLEDSPARAVLAVRWANTVWVFDTANRKKVGQIHLRYPPVSEIKWQPEQRRIWVSTHRGWEGYDLDTEIAKPSQETGLVPVAVFPHDFENLLPLPDGTIAIEKGRGYNPDRVVTIFEITRDGPHEIEKHLFKAHRVVARSPSYRLLLTDADPDPRGTHLTLGRIDRPEKPKRYPFSR